MTRLPIREAFLAGPRLVARRPGAVAVWAAVSVVQQLVYLAVLLASRRTGLLLGAGPVWGALVYLPFEALLIAAVFRAFLRPEAGRAAFLRVGPVEGRMLLVLLVATLAALLIALPTSIAATYLSFYLRQPLMAGSVLAVGSTVAGLALLRLAPLPAALVETGRVDLRAAWRSTRGQYLRLALLMVGIALAERLLLSAAAQVLPRAPYIDGLPALVSPLRLAAVGWHAVVGTASLVAMAGVVVAAWRAGRQNG